MSVATHHNWPYAIWRLVSPGVQQNALLISFILPSTPFFLFSSFEIPILQSCELLDLSSMSPFFFFLFNFPALPLTILEDFLKSVCQITNLIIGHICFMSQPTHWNFQMQSYFSFSRMIPSPLTTPFHNVCWWLRPSLRSSWRNKLGRKWVFFSSLNYLCLFQGEVFRFSTWTFPFVMCVFSQRLKIPQMLYLIYK